MRGAQLTSQAACNALGASSDFEEIITYDAAGNVLEQRKRDNARVKFVHDALGRTTKRELPGAEPDDYYCYDTFARLTDAGHGGTTCTSGQTIANSYDALGRMTAQTTKFGSTNLTVDFAYDAAGRRLWMEWPDNQRVAYAYDNTGAISRLCGVASGLTACASNAPTLLASYTYDNLGRADFVDWGNGADTDYVYDGVSRLTSLSHQALGLENFSFALTAYNPASQIVTRNVTADYRWTNPATASDAFVAPPRAKARALKVRPHNDYKNSSARMQVFSSSAFADGRAQSVHICGADLDAEL